MKQTKRFLAAALCTLMLAGCSSSVSKEVTTSCTATLPGANMEMTAVITAPSEDAEVSSIHFNFVMPFAAIREAAGDDAASLTDDQVKEIVKTQEDTYASTISSLLGVTQSDIKTEVTDEALKMDIAVKNFEKVRALLNVDSDEKMIYKDVVDDAKDSGFTCE